jgi:hypothetical protein
MNPPVAFLVPSVSHTMSLRWYRVLAPGGHLLVAFFESGCGPVAAFDHKVAPAFRWPIGDLAALAREAEFAEVGRMSRERREQEWFRRGHLLLRRQ